MSLSLAVMALGAGLAPAASDQRFVALSARNGPMGTAAAGVTVVVPGDADVFGAGLSAPPGFGGGGELPVALALPSDSSGIAVMFGGASGSVNCCAGASPYWNGPDGTPLNPTNINSFGGISGLRDAHAALFLAGVFLRGGDQPSTPPPRLDFSAGGSLGHNFRSLSPRLGQTFFIGDGFTADGRAQQFVVPDGATHLYLGFLDALSFTGDPGYYEDNRGSLTITVSAGTATAPIGPAGAIRLPDGRVSIPVTSVSLPDHLVISRIRFTPNPVRSRAVIRARFRIIDSRGYVVRGALVHALALPYGWTKKTVEVTTGNDGYAYVSIRPTKKMPVANDRALVIFVRARENRDSILGGVSTRRLVQLPLAGP
jgi:hypothetical protein